MPKGVYHRTKSPHNKGLKGGQLIPLAINSTLIVLSIVAPVSR